MPASALGLALAAACVHALWNVLLARARDVEAATAVALVVAEVAFAPVAAAAWRVQPAVWPFLVASGALQLLYFTLLATAYRLAELSVVYPIARGAAPVLVLVVGVAALGHATSAGQVAGVCLVALGVLLVRGLARDAGRGVPFGLAIACTIAAYTLVDKDGVTHAGAVPYLELAMAAPTAVYASAVAATKGVRALRAEWRPAAAVAGVATFGAYVLVLRALQRAAAAPVAAVRETSVVLAALLALPLVVVLFVDLRTRYVYSVVAYPGILAGLALSPLVRGGAPWDGLAGALAGTLVLGGLYLVGRLAYRGGEPLGSGDVTIGGLVGATVGLGALLPALVGGAVLNGLFAAALALRRRSLKSYLPYGPGLCLGALAALLA